MLLLITGNNRSGTTMTLRLCDSHPQVGLTNEFGGLFALGEPKKEFQRFLWQLWWQAQNRTFFRGERLWGKWCFDDIYMDKQLGTWGCFLSKMTRINMWQNGYFAACLGRNIRGEVADLTAVARSYQSIFPNTQVVGDNHPDYVYELDKFIQYPNIKIILIHRDPRDVTSDSLSRIRPRYWLNETTIKRDLRKWWPKNLSTAEQIAARWVNTIHLMESYQEQVCVLRYEELVTNPTAVVEQLAQLLEVEPAGFDTSFIQQGGGIGSHREGLSPQELDAVLTVAGSTMQRLGYE